jgi:hypothetical protein
VMGTRAAKGKSLVSPQTVKSVKKAAVGLKSQVGSVVPNLPASTVKKSRKGSSPKKAARGKTAKQMIRERPKRNSNKKRDPKRN